MDADARDTPSPPAGGACGASVSFAPEDSSRKLLELERTLAAKDAIMEPGVMDSLRTYVASGGKPAAAIELLSENYRGYAQMSSLACRWLELTEPACGDPAPKKAAASASRGAADLGRDPGAAGFSAAVSPVAQFNVRGGDASAVATPRDYGDELDTPTGGFTASRVFGDANAATPPPAGVSASAVAAADAAAAAAAALEGWRGRARKDEAHFLEELIRRTFDPRKVDAVKGRPAWLSRLLDSDRGRGVLFSLAEKHPDCLLITLAIQHAWQHGRADEVRALGPAAASYFSIFHELLADHFRDLIGAGEDEEARKSAVDAISSACCQSLATYLFAQMMLADLARGGDAGTETLPDEEVTKTNEAAPAKDDDAREKTEERGRLQTKALAVRVSQELEVSASRAHGAATVRRVAPLLAATDADAAAFRAAGDLLLGAEERRARRERGVGTGPGAGGSGTLLPDVALRKLRDMYLGDAAETGGGGAGAPAGGRARGGGAAAAAAGAGAPSHVSASPPPSAALTPAPLRSPALLRALFDEAFRWDPTGSAPERVSVSGARARAEARGARSACLDLIALAVSADARERSATRGDLDAALATLEAASRGEVPEEASFRALLARCPAAASGVAAWVGSAMGNPEHYKRVSATANTVAYLRALSEACRAGGAGVRGRALEVITDALRAMGRGSSEALHLATLDAAVELVEAGLVLPTLDAATEAWAGEIDPSHLRYFAGEVLEVAGPPYGGKFAAAALRLLRSANARRGMTRATDEFVDQCRRQRARGALAPPLGKELDDVLDRLAGNR